MRSHLLQDFRDCMQKLPISVQQAAKAAFRKFAANPFHPGSHYSLQNNSSAKSVPWLYCVSARFLLHFDPYYGEKIASLLLNGASVQRQ